MDALYDVLIGIGVGAFVFFIGAALVLFLVWAIGHGDS